MQIYWGIPGDHHCGNFLIISLWKFRKNEGEFSKWIFPPPFPIESLRKFPSYFPHISLKISKYNISMMKGSQWCEHIPVIVSCHSCWWIKKFTSWGTSLSYLLGFKKFPCGFSIHLQPKFPCGFPPPTITILGGSPQNPRDFARWGLIIRQSSPV